jgi:hypothetical protein
MDRPVSVVVAHRAKFRFWLSSRTRRLAAQAGTTARRVTL